MAKHSAEFWISSLGLEPHPEGGYFRESYRSGDAIPSSALPQEVNGDRSCSTAIYFLLTEETFSAFHSIRSDELWHFYDGQPVQIHVITASGAHETILLGRNPDCGEILQACVPAGSWFAAEPGRGGFSLVGCTVSPGFDFADFTLGNRAELTNRFPQHRTVIERLTRT